MTRTANEKIGKLVSELEELKERKFDFPEIIVDRCYKETVNLKADGFEAGCCDGFGERFIREIRPTVVISPVYLIPRFRKKIKIEKIRDYLDLDTFGSIFIDLENRIIDTGTSRSSGGRGRYDLLSALCEKNKVPTFIPVYVKSHLLRVYYFKRFVGGIMFQHQWNRSPRDLGLDCEDVSHIYREFHHNELSVVLYPEKKEINLLRFRKEVVN